MIRQHGLVVWLFGLSGAGKSTLCFKIENALCNLNHYVFVLDADSVRQHLCADLGFSDHDRTENIRRIGSVARMLADANFIVLVAAITPFDAMREGLKSMLPSLLMIYIDAPLSVCEKRDPKGLYKRARRGLLNEFTGISSRFEVPSNPDYTCHTDRETAQESTEMIIAQIMRRLKPPR